MCMSVMSVICLRMFMYGMSVLGPCLFLIYINDIDLNISGVMLKFADDTKVICSIEKGGNGATLQADLDTNKWQMQFNIGNVK